MLCAYTWPRYQMSVHRTIGPLVFLCVDAYRPSQQFSSHSGRSHIFLGITSTFSFLFLFFFWGGGGGKCCHNTAEISLF